MGKRGKLEIMRDILGIIRDSRGTIKPTPLLRKSNLSSARFKEYYSELASRELIKEIVGGKKDKRIILTEKGLRFLDKYRAIIDFIDEFEL